MTQDYLTQRLHLCDLMIGDADAIKVEVNSRRDVVIASRSIGECLTADRLNLYALTPTGKVMFTWAMTEDIGDARSARWPREPTVVLESPGDRGPVLVAIWALHEPTHAAPRSLPRTAWRLRELAVPLPGPDWELAVLRPSRRYPLTAALDAMAGA